MYICGDVHLYKHTQKQMYKPTSLPCLACSVGRPGEDTAPRSSGTLSSTEVCRTLSMSASGMDARAASSAFCLGVRSVFSHHLYDLPS